MPWFQLPKPVSPPARAVILGGGLAGSCAAYSLWARGWQVTLIERADRLGSAASGNPAAAILPPLSLKPSPWFRYHEAAYLSVLRRVFQWEKEGGKFGWSGGGVIQIPVHTRLRLQLEGLADAEISEEIARPMEARDAWRCSGVPIDRRVLYFRKGGFLDPAAWCRVHATRPGIVHILGRSAVSLYRGRGSWHVDDSRGGKLASGEVLILANAHEGKAYSQTAPLPISRVRGQLALISAEHFQRAPSIVICHEGYLIPLREGEILLGATWSREDSSPYLRKTDHDQLVQRARKWLPGLGLSEKTPLRGRVAFRSQTPDHLPLVGPVPDLEAFVSQYEDLHHGRTGKQYPPAVYHPGLFVSLGHGGRGVASTCLAGEILATQICGGSSPVPVSLMSEVHPARFLIRHFRTAPRNRTTDLP